MCGFACTCVSSCWVKKGKLRLKVNRVHSVPNAEIMSHVPSNRAIFWSRSEFYLSWCLHGQNVESQEKNIIKNLMKLFDWWSPVKHAYTERHFEVLVPQLVMLNIAVLRRMETGRLIESHQRTPSTVLLKLRQQNNPWVSKNRAGACGRRL